MIKSQSPLWGTWLLLLNVIFVGCIRVVVRSRSLFISLLIGVPVKDKANIFFKVHINFGEHLGCFQFGAIMNRGAMSLFYTSFGEHKFAFLLIKDPGSVACAGS